MITIEQCRAARGLLSWTQQDLADASGLSKTAINNFEKGHSDIKADSLRAIRMAFESADVEFMGMNGLRKRSESATMLKGDFAFSDLLQDIQDTLKEDGGEVLVLNAHAGFRGFSATSSVTKYRDYLSSIQAKERIICSTDSTQDWGEGEEQRTIDSPTLQTHMSSFIYGSKVALLLWGSKMIIVTNSTEASNAERRRFETLWSKATPAASTISASKQTISG